MADYSPSVSAAEGHRDEQVDSALAAALDAWTEDGEDECEQECRAGPSGCQKRGAADQEAGTQSVLRPVDVSLQLRSGIIALPHELLLRCCSFMSAVDLCGLGQACHFFRSLSAEQVLWRRLYCARWGKPREHHGDTPWKVIYQAKDAEDRVRWAADEAGSAVQADDPVAAMYREMQRARRQQTLGRGQVEDTMEVPRGALQEQLEWWRRRFPPVPPGQLPRVKQNLQTASQGLQGAPAISSASAGPGGASLRHQGRYQASHQSSAAGPSSRPHPTLSDDTRAAACGPHSLQSSPVSDHTYLNQSCSIFSEQYASGHAAASSQTAAQSRPANSSQSDVTAQLPSASRDRVYDHARGHESAAGTSSAHCESARAGPQRAQGPRDQHARQTRAHGALPAGVPRTWDDQQVAQRPMLGQLGRDAFTWDKLGDYFCCQETGWIHLCDQSCMEGVIDPSSGLFVCPISCRTVDRMLTDWDILLADSAREGHEEHELQDADFGGFVGRFYERGYNCRSMKELRDLHCGLGG